MQLKNLTREQLKFASITGAYAVICTAALVYVSRFEDIGLTLLLTSVFIVIATVFIESRQRLSADQALQKKLEAVTQNNKKSVAPKRVYASNEDFIAQHQKNSQSNHQEQFEPQMHSSTQALEDRILRAIEQNDIELFFQPVVRLPARRVAFFEIYARIKMGGETALPAAEYMEVARRNNVDTLVDFALMMQTLRVLKFTSDKLPVILNIEPETIKSPGFMRDLLAYMRENRSMANKLIFEIRQSALENIDDDTRRILKALSVLGCRLSMDQVEQPSVDRAFLREIGVRFIKISSSRLQKFTRDDKAIDLMHRIKNQFAKDDITIIADRVESEQVLKEILDLELDYGQGFVFGRPDRVGAYEKVLYAA